jgi:4-coumarate--CoA ligase
MRTYRSKDPDIDVPTDLSLTELLHSSARFPVLPVDRIIAQDDVEHRTLTIGQLRSRAGRLAAGLSHHYQPEGQSRWAIILPNSVAYLEVVHAVLWLGGVFCPINHQLKAGEIAHALAVSKPEYAIVYSEIVGKVVEAIELARETHPDLKKPKLLTAIGPRLEGYRCLFADFEVSEQLPVPHYEDTRERLASIHLSSGTTGNPKGVGLSHYNYIANVLQMWAHDPEHWSPAERVVSYTPFVHIANSKSMFPELRPLKSINSLIGRRDVIDDLVSNRAIVSRALDRDGTHHHGDL